MSTTFPITTSPAAGSDAPFELTVEIYARMVESGLIPRDRRVYLRDGRLYEKMAKTRAHGYVGAAVVRAIQPNLPQGWSLWPESTVEFDRANAPLPDFTIVRGGNPLDFGSPDRYPGPADVAVVIEVAVSSLQEDLTTALELYARFGISVNWVLDVTGGRVLVHSEPRVTGGRGEYARLETFRAGQSIPLVLDGQEAARVPFEELFR